MWVCRPSVCCMWVYGLSAHVCISTDIVITCNSVLKETKCRFKIIIILSAFCSRRRAFCSFCSLHIHLYLSSPRMFGALWPGLLLCSKIFSFFKKTTTNSVHDSASIFMSAPKGCCWVDKSFLLKTTFSFMQI